MAAYEMRSQYLLLSQSDNKLHTQTPNAAHKLFICMAVSSGDHSVSRTEYVYINDDQDTVSHLHDPLFYWDVKYFKRR